MAGPMIYHHGNLVDIILQFVLMGKYTSFNLLCIVVWIHLFMMIMIDKKMKEDTMSHQN